MTNITITAEKANRIVELLSDLHADAEGEYAQEIDELCGALLADQDSTIEQLRAQGYAVSVWSPDELDGRCPMDMEDHLGRTGNEFLEFD